MVMRDRMGGHSGFQGMRMHRAAFGGHLFEMADANHDGRITLPEATNAALQHFDRADLGLTGRQQALADAVIAIGKPVVLVLVNGRSLAIPKLVKNVPSEILIPKNTWADKAAYDAIAKKLATLFNENFKKYADQASDAVRAAAPKI